MTPSAAIDTHGAVWYLTADRRLSERARRFLETSAQGGMSVLVSPITLVEVVYLCEKGRVPWNALARLEAALQLGNTVLQVADLTLEVARAVARVLRDEVPVISRDGKIQTSAVPTIW